MDKPLHVFLEMKDDIGNHYIVEGIDDDNMAFSLMDSPDMKVNFNFENFARYVWMNKLMFVGEKGKKVPAFTGINELCEDLKNEKAVTRVFYIEKLKMFWYIPRTGTFVNAEGIFRPGDMPKGNYMYEIFGNEEITSLLSERATYFRKEIMEYDDVEVFARHINVAPLLYQQFEEGICLPQVKMAILRTYPWLNPAWLDGRS
jgi:hypothetical protein